MLELVDKTDLGSVGYFPWGFKSLFAYIEHKQNCE